MNELNSSHTILKINPSLLKEINDWQVLLGFAGFGNVGYNALSHIIETTELESFTFWGNNTWFYRGNLESIITGYLHRKSKTIIITSRIPIFVTNLSKQFWDKMIEDIISWKCKKYIIIGGLKEETRLPGSTDWAAYVPTKQWSKLYKHERSFADKLSMIGPLSSLLALGTTHNLPVLGLLAYSNTEEDPEASSIALAHIESLTGIEIPSKNFLHVFDYSFLSMGTITPNIVSEEDFDEDFDIDDLL